MANPVRKIHVYKDSDGEFRVYPPVMLVSGKSSALDDVVVVNHTDEDAIWLVPAGPFHATNASVEPAPKGHGKSNAKTALNTDVSTSYVVYMLQSGKKAKGNSDPVIIVET